MLEGTCFLVNPFWLLPRISQAMGIYILLRRVSDELLTIPHASDGRKGDKEGFSLTRATTSSPVRQHRNAHPEFLVAHPR